MTRLSLVIATYNRAECLMVTLASVAEQSAKPQKWECIVVDNNSKDDGYVEECVAQFRRYYVDNIDRHTLPYEGMVELLEELCQRGVAVAVASNKFQHGTERLISKFFGNIEFVAIEGNREGEPLKPDPRIVEKIIAIAGAKRERTVMVGDSGIDIRTAAAANIASIGVAWGFRYADELYDAGATTVVTKTDELRTLLLAE